MSRSISKEDLWRYLVENPGTAALRELREELVQEGVELDTIRPQPKRPSSVSGDMAAWDKLVAEMEQVAATGQYSLATVPRYLAGSAGRFLISAADADGTVSEQSVQEKLGAEGSRLFDLLLGSMEKAGATAAGPTTDAASAANGLGDNALGLDRQLPDRLPIQLPPELMRRIPFQMRLTDLNEFARLRQAVRDRAARRAPARRIAAVMNEPKQTVETPAAFRELVGEAEAQQSFRGAKLLCVQHLYPSTQALIEGCMTGGIAANDVTVLGKPYSGTTRTAAAILKNGNKLVVPSLGQSELADNESYSRELIEEQVRRLIAEPGDGPILVLDDGGQVARVVAEHPDLARHAGRFRFVEQTQHGVNEVRESKIEAPWVPAGEAWLKKTYESPSVAHCIANSVEGRLEHLAEQGIATEREATVMGAGDIGLSVARRLLKAGWKVHLYDPDGGALDAAAEELKGLRGWTVESNRTAALRQAHVCIGASGNVSLSIEDLEELPDNPVMVNAASGNHEQSSALMLVLQLIAGNDIAGTLQVTGNGVTIPRELLHSLDTAVLDEQGAMWDMFRGKQVCLGQDDNPAQRDRVVHTPGGKSLYYVKGGFVANLHEGPNDPIDLRYFVTLPLLFGSLMQVMDSKQPGEQLPAEALQQRIHKAYAADLAASGEDLLDPTF